MPKRDPFRADPPADVSIGWIDTEWHRRHPQPLPTGEDREQFIARLAAVLLAIHSAEDRP